MCDTDTIRREKIVADGRQRLLDTQKEERAAIRVAVRRRYAEEMRSASFLRKLFLEWKISRETRAEMQKRISVGTLHVTPFSK